MTENVPAPQPALLWTGRILTALPILGLFASAGIKLSQSPEVLEAFQKYGYPTSTLVQIALFEVICAILCAIPQTAVFGAILATAYLGGASATHVMAGEPFVAPVVFGVLLWTGIGLRDARLRRLLPFRFL